MRECGNCGVKENLHVHHIVPRGLGGTERPTNKVDLCIDCHAKVHGKDAGYAEALKRGMAKARAEGRIYKTPLKLTFEVKEKIKSLCESGHTTKEISALLNINGSSIDSVKRQFGIPSSRVTIEHGRAIRNLLLRTGGRYTQEIADKFGYTRRTIQNIKRKMSLMLPAGGQRGPKLSFEYFANQTELL